MKKPGFTLIELVAAIVIMLIVTMAVATGVKNIRGASASAEAGKIAVAARYLYNLAVVSGHNQRLVIDIEARSWWGEEQTSDDPCEAFLLPGKDDVDEPAGKGKGDPKDPGKPTNVGGFEPSKSTLLQKTEMDKGITFSGVLTTHQNQVVEKGQAFIYFFPNGTTEHALIQVKADDNDKTTVEISAMQGTAKIRGDDLDLNDLLREFAKELQ